MRVELRRLYRTHMVAMLLAASNVVGLLVSPSAPVSRDAGHAVRRSTQLQMGVVRQRGLQP